MITLKRAYDPVSRTDGTRFLVERLWPRGVSKAKLRVDAWLKEVGPSTELRKWFSHDPEKWGEFRRRYFRELGSRPEAWQPIVAAARRGTVTLVYSSHDTQHNNAVALQEYLRRRRAGRRGPRGRARRTGRADWCDETLHGSPPSVTRVHATSGSAVPSRSYGVGAQTPFPQSDRSLGWHDVPTCDRGGRTADRTGGAAGRLVCRADAARDGDATAADAAGETTCAIDR